MAASPLPSRGPKRGRKCYVTPAFSGIPNKGELKLTWLPHPCLVRGPIEGGNAMSPLQFRVSPTPSAGSKSKVVRKKRGIKSEVAASPLPSRGPKRGRKCHVTPAFSGIPNAKSGEQNQKWSPTKGNKIRSGCLTRAFLGAQRRGEMLSNPCLLRGLRTGVQKRPSPGQWKKAPHGGRR